MLRSLETRVGLVVLAALFIFLFSLFWAKDFRLNRDRYELYIVFSTVGGLSEGDPVQVAGVQKGRVTAIQLQSNGVKVTISLDGDVQLPADSRFSIQNMGLMGEKFVAVEPGPGLCVLTGGKDTVGAASPDRPGARQAALPEGVPPGILKPGQTLSGNYRGGMSEIMGEVEELLRVVQGLANTFNETIGNPQARASIQESLENVRRFSQVLADLVDEQGGELSLALQDLRTASEGFRVLVQDNRTQVDSTLDQFHRASMDLEQLTTQLTEVSSTFKRLADKVERGEGSLGEFVADETLYRDIKQTVKNLDDLIQEIKENPQKYLKLEIF
jgi:phospholipid/cholesterol/gamma-HCH transport system substrate-binding protein